MAQTVVELPILLVALLLCAGCRVMSPGAGGARSAFLSTYFTDNGQSGIYLACSDDGLTFRPLVEPNVPILRPEVGAEHLTRDPNLFRGPDGRWHLCWTTGWWETDIGLAHSDDLVHWSTQRLLPVMQHATGALNAWAPEIAYDRKSERYLIFWSSTVPGRFQETEAGGDPGPKPGVKLNHRIYATTTRDFESFESCSLFYDPGFNCIDATILDLRTPFSGALLLFKDETRFPPAKNIRVARGTIATGFAPHASPPITGTYWAEGPTAFQIGGTVRVLFDRYTEGRFGAVESTDLEHWSDITERVTFPKGARHGSVVVVDVAELERLRMALSSR